MLPDWSIKLWSVRFHHYLFHACFLHVSAAAIMTRASTRLEIVHDNFVVIWFCTCVNIQPFWGALPDICRTVLICLDRSPARIWALLIQSCEALWDHLKYTVCFYTIVIDAKSTRFDFMGILQTVALKVHLIILNLQPIYTTRPQSSQEEPGCLPSLGLPEDVFCFEWQIRGSRAQAFDDQPWITKQHLGVAHQ